MNLTVEVTDVGLQVLLVFVPGDPINSDSRRLLQMEEGFGQAVFVNVVQQGSELELAALAGSFAHTVQSAGPAQ